MIDFDCYIVGLSRFTISPDFTVWGFFITAHMGILEITQSLLPKSLYWFFKVLYSYETILLQLKWVVKNFLKFFSTFFGVVFNVLSRSDNDSIVQLISVVNNFLKVFFGMITIVFVIDSPYNHRTIRYILILRFILIYNHCTNWDSFSFNNISDHSYYFRPTSPAETI